MYPWLDAGHAARRVPLGVRRSNHGSIHSVLASAGAEIALQKIETDIGVVMPTALKYWRLVGTRPPANEVPLPRRRERAAR